MNNDPANNDPPSAGASTEIGPLVRAIQAAMRRFAHAHLLLGNVNDRGPADQALSEAINAYRRAAVAAERDCRTCANYTAHHRAGVMHCAAPARCVAASSYRRAGRVRAWEAAPAATASENETMAAVTLRLDDRHAAALAALAVEQDMSPPR